MYDALQHPVFASLRLPSPADCCNSPHAASNSNSALFMHYYRGGADEGGDALPIL